MQQPVSRNVAAVHLLKLQAGGDDPGRAECNDGDVALLRSRGNNAADPLLCHTGHDNCGDGIRMTVVAVIISNRRDLIVSPQCGGLVPGVSAVRVRSGHTGGCTDLILLIFYAFIIIPGVLNENETLPEMN